MLALLLAGCAGRGPVLAPRLPAGSAAPSVELAETPFFAQTDYQCGPAALATVLQSAGVEVAPEDLSSQVYLPGRRGSLQAELIAATRGYDRLPYVLAPNLDAVLGELQAGRPVLVLQNLGVSSFPVWHYAVVIGYRLRDDAMVLRSGTRKRRVTTAARFLDTWERAERWALVVLRPGELPANPEPHAYLTAVAALEELGRLRPARDAYAAAVARWPHNPNAWLGLGNAEYGLGRLPQAESGLRRVVALQDDNVIARNNLAHVLAERGCFAEARAQIETALAAQPRTSALYPQLVQTRDDIVTQQARSRRLSKQASCRAAADSEP